jgi:hypothetical protein
VRRPGAADHRGVPDIGVAAILDLPDWIHTVLRAKNWLLAGLLIAVVVTTLLGKRR